LTTSSIPSPWGVKPSDIDARLKEHRQQLDAFQKRLQDFEWRMERFRQRQQALAAQIEIVEREMEYFGILREGWQRKQQERLWQVNEHFW
jgi:chromosome segregation ATPase